jgi:hypothetical protein
MPGPMEKMQSLRDMEPSLPYCNWKRDSLLALADINRIYATQQTADLSER